jgi:prepilin-type N-terminal cleavage/methylation domain-containing protein
MRLKRDDRGMTLIEIMMALAILGIIVAPLAMALIGFMRNADQTAQRMNENHDLQIATAYFAQDVQAMGVHDWTVAAPYPLRQSIELNAPASGGIYQCDAGGTPNALVRFAWDDPNTLANDPVVIRASYVVMTVNGERQLRRITCEGTTLTSNVVLAHNLDTTAPVVTCFSPSTCTAAPGIPQKVQIVLTIRDPANTGSPVTVTLFGQRRQT